MADLVFLEKSNGVAYVIMNSPPANAMSPDLLKQFLQCPIQFQEHLYLLPFPNQPYLKGDVLFYT